MKKRKNLIVVISVVVMIIIVLTLIGYLMKKTNIANTNELNTTKTQEINQVTDKISVTSIEASIANDSSDYKKIGNDFYFKKDSTIRIKVESNRTINDEVIEINFVNQSEQRTYRVKRSTNYPINHNFQIYEFNAPENFSGYASTITLPDSYHTQLPFNNESKVYVDTVPLRVKNAWIHVDTSLGYTGINGNCYLKEGSKIRIGVTFNKDVYDDRDKSRR